MATHPVQLPSSQALPFLDRHSISIAQDFCDAAQHWLNATGHLLIACGVGSSGSFAASWDRKLRRHDGIDPATAASAMRHAHCLLDRLIARWPASVAPMRIGLISDGSGAALAPEDPWPLAPGWIERRLSRPATLMAVRRFDPAGHWARLHAEQGRRLH